MNWHRLSLVTGPASLPISVEEAKAQGRVDVGDEEALFAWYVNAAAEAIDGPKGIGICMVSQQWKLTLDRFPSRPDHIRIPLGPVISVDTITYVDPAGATQTLAPADYRLMNAGDLVILEPVFGGTWPSTRHVLGAVEITFTAGHAQVPDILKLAVAMLAAHWFENREASGEEGRQEVPYGVRHILDLYRAGVVAA